MTRNEVLVDAIMALANDDYGSEQHAHARKAIETLVQSADEHALMWAENYAFGEVAVKRELRTGAPPSLLGVRKLLAAADGRRARRRADR